MREERKIKILSSLDNERFITSEELATSLNVSSKTIRNEIRKINADLAKYKAYIEIKPKHGCKLVVNDHELFEQYLKSISSEEENIPNNAKERVFYILQLLLTNDDWIKVEDLCERLYVSQSSLSLNLKDVRNYLEEYNILLLSKPGYGLKIQGNEFDIRLCLANLSFINREENPRAFLEDKQKVLRDIRSILYRIFQKYNYHMTDFSFENLVIHIFVALYRAKECCEAQLSDDQINKIKHE